MLKKKIAVLFGTVFRRDDGGTVGARRSAEEVVQLGRRQRLETDPASDCDPGNSGGNNNGKD